MSIYIIGHKSPDLDSVAAAIAYANFKNQKEPEGQYLPALAGKPNKETVYLLDKFGIDMPEILDSVSGREIIMVDHNEFQQAADGIGEAKILEILDHHKLDFKYSEPICITTKPWGAVNSLITEMYFAENVAIDKSMAALMLGAILIDTVITKSPTCTAKDKGVIEKLAMLSGLPDWEAYGLELFKVRSSVSELSDTEIIRSDFKNFNFKVGTFGIGQVETVDLGEFVQREDAIMAELDKIKTAGNYHTVILFITDIIKEGSRFLIVSSDLSGVETAFGAKTENGKVYLPGVLSRKKQVTPKLAAVFDK
jgi:manganese-dependent inorganic pyrophosphatase